MVFRGSCHGLPWKSAGFHGKGPGFLLFMALPRQVPRLWPWHVPWFCPWQPPWYQPYGNPRKYYGNCHDIFHGHLHVNCRGNPRQLTANATAFDGNCHGNPPTASAMAKRGNCHGIPRLLPRQFPRTSNHSNFHGIPRSSVAIGTAILQQAAIATEPHGNCHDNFHGRQSTAISTENHGTPQPSAAILPHSAPIGGDWPWANFYPN